MGSERTTTRPCARRRWRCGTRRRSRARRCTTRARRRGWAPRRSGRPRARDVSHVAGRGREGTAEVGVRRGEAAARHERVAASQAAAVCGGAAGAGEAHRASRAVDRQSYKIDRQPPSFGSPRARSARSARSAHARRTHGACVEGRRRWCVEPPARHPVGQGASRAALRLMHVPPRAFRGRASRAIHVERHTRARCCRSAGGTARSGPRAWGWCDPEWCTHSATGSSRPTRARSAALVHDDGLGMRNVSQPSAISSLGAHVAQQLGLAAQPVRRAVRRRPPPQHRQARDGRQWRGRARRRAGWGTSAATRARCCRSAHGSAGRTSASPMRAQSRACRRACRWRNIHVSSCRACHVLRDGKSHRP